MQTVINNYIIGSTVISGNTGCEISTQNYSQNTVCSFIGEAVRIMGSLNVKQQMAAMQFLYDLEDGKRLPTSLEVSL